MFALDGLFAFLNRRLLVVLPLRLVGFPFAFESRWKVEASIAVEVLKGETFDDGRGEWDDVRTGMVGGDWFSDGAVRVFGVLPGDEVGPVPSTTSSCIPLWVDVLAAVEEAELTYVADGEGLSRAVVVESAIESTRVGGSQDQHHGDYHKLEQLERQSSLKASEEFPLSRS